MSSNDDYFVDDTEPLLSVDKYYKPLVAKDFDYTTLLLIRLILLEPGTIQTHPDCGVGLVSKFRYSTNVDMRDLENRIKEQITKYLPQFSLSKIRCELEDKVIKIYITSKEVNVLLPINTQTGEVIDKNTHLHDFR
jgi:hypothetical protein